jgi:membrane-associated protein
MHLDLISLIGAIGSIGIIAIVFAESGLFFGFFLPGDSLLFTAGLLAASSVLPFTTLLIALPVAAILGDSVGYWFGKKVGPALFKREESRFFKPKHVEDAHRFFLRHGKKALVLARFMPIFRTFVPIIAGVAKMPYPDFISYNIIGGIAWSLSMFLLGYFAGNVIPNPERFLYPVVLVIIIISFLPVAYEYLKAKKEKKMSGKGDGV